MDAVPGRLAEESPPGMRTAANIRWMASRWVPADWHFNVRASNTEPLLRLNLEATTPEMMERKRDEVLSLIRA